MHIIIHISPPIWVMFEIFVFLSFFCKSLSCLSFGLRNLINPLVSSNSSMETISYTYLLQTVDLKIAFVQSRLLPRLDCLNCYKYRPMICMDMLGYMWCLRYHKIDKSMYQKNCCNTVNKKVKIQQINKVKNTIIKKAKIQLNK